MTIEDKIEQIIVNEFKNTQATKAAIKLHALGVTEENMRDLSNNILQYKFSYPQCIDVWNELRDLYKNS